MTTTRHLETTINVPAGEPTIEIVREFDAPPSAVFRAHVDPELYVRWIGPRSITTRIVDWDCTTGGRWRYVAERGGEQIASMYGSFHEVREPERIVQTFTWEGAPDGVSLEVMTLEELPGGRTLMRAVSVGQSVEERDAMVASGMTTGIVEGYEKLDELLGQTD